MEKLTMHSVDGVSLNVERIATLFHNDVTLKIECKKFCAILRYINKSYN